MSDEQKEKERLLFSQLVITFYESAWQGMGKVMSPVSGKVERNLEAARHYIDILDMLKARTSGNLEPDEVSFLDGALYQLKMNYVEEIEADKKATAEAEPTEETADKGGADTDRIEPAEAKEKKTEKPKTKAKTTGDKKPKSKRRTTVKKNSVKSSKDKK